MIERIHDRLEKEFNKALQFREVGDYESAYNIFSQLAMLHPDSNPVWGMLGAMCFQLNRFPEAIRAFRRTIELSPDSELASLGMFQSLIEVGDEQAALLEMKRYLATHSSKEYDLILEELESESIRRN